MIKMIMVDEMMTMEVGGGDEGGCDDESDDRAVGGGGDDEGDRTHLLSAL